MSKDILITRCVVPTMSINDPNDYSYKSSKMVLLKDLTAKLKGYLFAVCILKK